MRAHFKTTYSDQLCINVVPETDDERRLLAAWIRLANAEGRRWGMGSHDSETDVPGCTGAAFVATVPHDPPRA